MNATSFYYLVYDNNTNISQQNVSSNWNLTALGNTTAYSNWNESTTVESTTKHLISGAFSDDLALNIPYTFLLVLTTITGNLGKSKFFFSFLSLLYHYCIHCQLRGPILVNRNASTSLNHLGIRCSFYQYLPMAESHAIGYRSMTLGGVDQPSINFD